MRRIVLPSRQCGKTAEAEAARNVGKLSAEQLRWIMRSWLDADDATHWGSFETDLDALLEKHK